MITRQAFREIKGFQGNRYQSGGNDGGKGNLLRTDDKDMSYLFTIMKNGDIVAYDCLENKRDVEKLDSNINLRKETFPYKLTKVKTGKNRRPTDTKKQNPNRPKKGY